MQDILKLIHERHSTRAPFDPQRPVAKEDLHKILEAARWAPTAHNMQNYCVVVVDDARRIEELGAIASHISEEFIRENYEQLSFSEEELREKKVGILGTMFPPTWLNPSKVEEAVRETSSLKQTIRESPLLLVVIYDTTKRAPASEGDVLGIMSLGCVMENMWLMAQSLGICFMIMSVFNADPVEGEIKRTLGIPEHMKIAYACRLGYPRAPATYLRVRRALSDFTCYNRFGERQE
jgi:nitroreductase